MRGLNPCTLESVPEVSMSSSALLPCGRVDDGRVVPLRIGSPYRIALGLKLKLSRPSGPKPFLPVHRSGFREIHLDWDLFSQNRGCTRSQESDPPSPLVPSETLLGGGSLSNDSSHPGR